MQALRLLLEKLRLCLFLIHMFEASADISRSVARLTRAVNERGPVHFAAFLSLLFPTRSMYI